MRHLEEVKCPKGQRKGFYHVLLSIDGKRKLRLIWGKGGKEKQGRGDRSAGGGGGRKVVLGLLSGGEMLGQK